ncbi:MAG TPA: hypothetical protein EYP10_11485 [Armatimonadetes bacterium]|nr:hypothetical protein [Armatimonadota bacterium]
MPLRLLPKGYTINMMRQCRMSECQLNLNNGKRGWSHLLSLTRAVVNYELYLENCRWDKAS